MASDLWQAQLENPVFWDNPCPILQITILYLGQLQSLLLKAYTVSLANFNVLVDQINPLYLTAKAF